MHIVRCTNIPITSCCPESALRTHFSPHGVTKNDAVRPNIGRIRWCHWCRHTARQRIHTGLADLRVQDVGARMRVYVPSIRSVGRAAAVSCGSGESIRVWEAF